MKMAAIPHVPRTNITPAITPQGYGSSDSTGDLAIEMDGPQLPDAQGDSASSHGSEGDRRGTSPESSQQPADLLSTKQRVQASRPRLDVYSALSFLREKLFATPFIPDGRYDSIKTEKISDYPAGYPQLAAFMNSDPDFSVFRRFGILRTRVLLYRQHELAKLEERLCEMDKKDEQEHKFRLQSIRKDKADTESSRTQVIEEIDQKLKDYDELLSRERESRKMARPTQRNYESLLNYLWNEKSIVKSEITFSGRSDDFIILSEEQQSPFHEFVQDIVYNYGGKGLRKWLSTKAQRESTENELIHLVSPWRVSILVQIIVTIMFSTIFMIPVGLLSALTTTLHFKLCIIFASMLLFPIIVYIFSRPRNQELCAMTAAYAAVLVVFLSNVTGTPISNSQN